jgi:hypothetical protein
MRHLGTLEGAGILGGNAVLALEGGGTVALIIRSVDFEHDAAAVTISGPVPGF